MNAPARAVFTQGSIFRHVAVMTLTSAVGMMAVFLIDLLSMYYISMAHRDDWRAAIAVVSKVLYFPFSLNMGMAVGVGTVVSIAIGRGDRETARRAATLGLVATATLGLAISLPAMAFRGEILGLFGAEGEALDAASRLLALMLPMNACLGVGMICASILRARGDAKGAMWVTLVGVVAISTMDPLFIFGFRLGVDGVGVAVVVSRLAMAALGLWRVIRVHGMLAPLTPRGLDQFAPIAAIAAPAMATNLALPFADWMVTRAIWEFGVKASSAAGVYDRIMPLAFSLVIALSGAIGPIVGQNLGAGAYDRVRRTFVVSLGAACGYSLVAWAIVFASAPWMSGAFGLSGSAADFFLFLCRWGTFAWFFVGLLMVANAIFNTLGHAQLATAFSWGRATLGTLPFVWLGARSGNAETAMMGIIAGAMLFALTALMVARGLVRRLEPLPLPAKRPAAASVGTA